MSQNVDLTATLAMHSAEVRALLAALEAGLKEVGLENIQGVPISQWIRHRRLEELQAVLIAMEDVNPAAAANVLQRLDAATNVMTVVVTLPWNGTAGKGFQSRCPSAILK